MQWSEPEQACAGPPLRQPDLRRVHGTRSLAFRRRRLALVLGMRSTNARSDGRARSSAISRRSMRRAGWRSRITAAPEAPSKSTHSFPGARLSHRSGQSSRRHDSRHGYGGSRRRRCRSAAHSRDHADHGLVVDVLLGPYPTADWLLRLPAEDSSRPRSASAYWRSTHRLRRSSIPQRRSTPSSSSPPAIEFAQKPSPVNTAERSR